MRGAEENEGDSMRVLKPLLLFLLLLMLVLVGTTSALQVKLLSGELKENPVEGELVNFTLAISDFPEGYILSFDTDLSVHNDKYLFNLTNLNMTFREKHFEIQTPNHEIYAQAIGEIPRVTEVRQCDGLTLVKYKQKTGAYYRIKLLDEKGNLIDSSIKTFEVRIPEREEFNRKVGEINDERARDFLLNLHEKGLVSESKELAEILIKMEKEKGVPLWLFILSVILAAFFAYIVGVHICAKRGEEEEEEIEEEEGESRE